MAEQAGQDRQVVMRRNPWQQLDRLQEELDRWWGGDGFWSRPFFRAMPGMEWRPSVDVFEDGNDLVVQAELPGVKREDIVVELDDDVLIIRGSKSEAKEVKQEHYHRMERSSGTFQRRIPLPVKPEPEAVKATFRDGILELRLPKPAPQPPTAKKIAVQ